jgi:translation initiation factor 4G
MSTYNNSYRNSSIHKAPFTPPSQQNNNQQQQQQPNFNQNTTPNNQQQQSRVYMHGPNPNGNPNATSSAQTASRIIPQPQNIQQTQQPPQQQQQQQTQNAVGGAYHTPTSAQNNNTHLPSNPAPQTQTNTPQTQTVQQQQQPGPNGIVANGGVYQNSNNNEQFTIYNQSSQANPQSQPRQGTGGGSGVGGGGVGIVNMQGPGAGPSGGPPLMISSMIPFSTNPNYPYYPGDQYGAMHVSQQQYGPPQQQYMPQYISQYMPANMHQQQHHQQQHQPQHQQQQQHQPAGPQNPNVSITQSNLALNNNNNNRPGVVGGSVPGSGPVDQQSQQAHHVLQSAPQPTYNPNVGVNVAQQQVPILNQVVQQQPPSQTMYTNYHNPYVIHQPVIAAPVKRERKPLAIVDPSTKQVINIAATTGAAAATTTPTTTATTPTTTTTTTSTSDKIENIPKSSTQPSISSLQSTKNSNNSENNLSSTAAPTVAAKTPTPPPITAATTTPQLPTTTVSIPLITNNSTSTTSKNNLATNSTSTNANTVLTSNKPAEQQKKPIISTPDIQLAVLNQMKAVEETTAAKVVSSNDDTKTKNTTPTTSATSTATSSSALPNAEQKKSENVKPTPTPTPTVATVHPAAATATAATPIVNVTAPMSYSKMASVIPKTAIPTSQHKTNASTVPINNSNKKSTGPTPTGHGARQSNDNNNNKSNSNAKQTQLEANKKNIEPTVTKSIDTTDRASTKQPPHHDIQKTSTAVTDNSTTTTTTQKQTPPAAAPPSVVAAATIPPPQAQVVVSLASVVASKQAPISQQQPSVHKRAAAEPKAVSKPTVNIEAESIKPPPPPPTPPVTNMPEATPTAAAVHQITDNLASLKVNETNKPSTQEEIKPSPDETNTITTTTTTPSEKNKFDLNLTCWTPENLDGKKRYDRDFLMSFKEKKLSRTFPDILSKYTELLFSPTDTSMSGAPTLTKQGSMQYDSYNKNKVYGNSMGSDGVQSYGKGSMNKGKGGNKGSMNLMGNKGYNKGSDGGYGHGAPSVVINLPEKIQLNVSENPYQIKKTQSDLNEFEELLREVRNILNKLTPQNIQKLTSDLISLPINNEERLKSAIDIIFEKSIDEQVFSQTYANLCKVLAHIKVPSNTEPNKIVNVRTKLLTKCQKEFDTDIYTDINYDKLIEEVNAQTDEAKKREMQELADDKLLRAKRRSLGNIRFIGELFKLNMLTEGIMHDCIERLLKQESDEENIECLCRLLTTIGKEVDKANNAAKMKGFFDRLEKIVKKKDCVTARIRFMILDVIELRKSNWVPRRKDNNPRRIEEIRREAEEEQQRIADEIARNQQHDKRNAQGNMQGGGKGGQNKGGNYNQGQQSLKSTSMDSESYSRQNKQQAGNMVNTIKGVKQITNITKLGNDIALGPGGGGGGFSWNKLKAPVSSSEAASSTPTTLTSSSSFSQTSSQQHQHQQHQQQPRTLTSTQSMNHGLKSKPNLSEPVSRLSMDSNKNMASKQLQNVKRMDGGSQQWNNNRSETSSQASSRETSQSRQQSRDNSQTRTSSDSPHQSSNNQRVYTSAEIERKAGLTIDEFIQNKDVSEATKDLEEFRPVDSSQLIAYYEQLVIKVLERSEQARLAVGQLFAKAVLDKKIDINYLTEAFKSLFDNAQDMAIDVPKIATYLSQIIGPMFHKDISLKFLTVACEPIKETKICAELILEILRCASNRMGHTTVTDIFKSSKLSINDFLESVSNKTEFLKENNIQWILGNRERTQSASVSTESFENKLFQILENTKVENEVIFDKIENEFSDSDCTSKAFIRALVLALCRSCLTDSDTQLKIDAELFKKRSPIMSKFVTNEDLELESLYAIQCLDHRTQHLPSFIRLIFDLLYDEDIINESVFYKWKTEVREEGHAISVLSLKAFFEWLSEVDAENAVQDNTA